MKKKYFSFLFLIGLFHSYSQTVGLTQHTSGTLDDGYVLFAPNTSNTTYLIDKCGKQVKSWNSAYKPGQSVYLLADGTLFHTGNANNTTFNAGGKGGIVEKIDWNGNVTWSYSISDATKCQHHDAKILPNGNVLLIAWELKTNAQAIAQGRNSALVPSVLWSEQILEIQPVGAAGGNVVWEWHLWDHLAQDFDATKPNYTTIASNPQLLNINYGASATVSDWIHMNALDYNPTLDQIVMSSHNLNEVWIIDHSTTTAQAASHIGGNSGKGGDFLYRWGNPQAYNNGTAANQKFFGQHNVRWIEAGLPYENQLMIFNNGLARTGGNYSTVEIINPPVTGYTYTPTLPYLPTTTSWIYNAGNPNSLYAMNISGAQQLSNGNVLICNGPSGIFTEINSTGTTLWRYINPVNQTGVISQGTTPTQNSVFRCSFYPNNYSGFSGHVLTAGNTIENTNTVSASCSLTLAVSDIELSNDIKVYPNPVKDNLYINFGNVDFRASQIQLYNSLGQKVYENEVTNSEMIIPIVNYSKGIYFLKVNSYNQQLTKKVIIN